MANACPNAFLAAASPTEPEQAVTTMNDNTPVLVGAGQVTERQPDPQRSVMDLIEAASSAAVADSGAAAALTEALSAVACVNISIPPYPNAPGLLAHRLGAEPAEAVYTTVGGNTPHSLIAHYGGRIAAGEVDSVLLAGGEALSSIMKAGAAPDRMVKRDTENVPDLGKPTIFGDETAPTSDYETAHNLQLPTQIYPLFENALRAANGDDIDKHQKRLGGLCAKLARVAADNPNAWFREAVDAETIATPGDKNRWVGFPYTKRMNAIISVDQAAAVVLTSARKARELGIPEERWVYVRAAGEAADTWFFSERAALHRSPAVATLGHAALEAGGLGIDDVNAFDIYSCFPCAVQMAGEALGLDVHADDRPLTLTGGLPYHGGPGSNYSMHAIAETVARLRERRDENVICTSVGWYMTKHALGVYSGRPPENGWTPLDGKSLTARAEEGNKVDLVREPEGEGEIETYTVVYDRQQQPTQGIVLGRMDDGRRFLANTPNDADLLEGMTRDEAIGRRGDVSTAGKTNLFEPH